MKMAAILKFPGIHFIILICAITTTLLCFEARFILAQSGRLAEDEKNALREIAQQLGKKNWNFSLDPCDGNSNWLTPKRNGIPLPYNNTVLCNCSYPEGVCHVQSIILARQDLAGVLPPSLSKLQYLKIIDFTRNYLYGTIPPEWASLKLESMDFTVNRLSGPIPKYLGNMTTLMYLSLESNQFNGTIPAELGNLSNLVKLVLNANNLTGKLPLQLNNLKNLIELRLSSNNFIGKLPSFQSWPNLEKLELQASGFQGPLSSGISNLINLTDLRIAYLNGGGTSGLPVLGNLTKMIRLMLRSCNITGTIPEDLLNMQNLQNLDLSFNKFEGRIPNLEGLTRLEALILTSNSLTGPIPEWIKIRDTRDIYDLSYNNFEQSSAPPNCRETLNLFRSFKSGNTSQLGNCVSRCSKDYYFFHVNCGGKNMKIGNRVFEDDEDTSGAAKFVPNPMKIWGTSSTGYFWDHNRTLSDYVAHNVSVLKVNDSELYMTARLSPLSLTYYGNCLASGNYTVTLHFAEIMFRNNRSYQSLGRRLFDVYIQGEKKLKDFDIEQEAKGVDKSVKKSFTVMVKDKILEIRFQYTGKGTTAIPNRGTYGPLISAISVESDFKPPDKEKQKILIATGASLLGLTLIIGVIGFCWWDHYIGRRISRKKELRGLDLQTGFTYRHIKAATNNFGAENEIGKGGFGYVYKGLLLDGTAIAVKQLSSKSKQGNHDFLNEIAVISALQHPNLVKLYGCCIEGDQLLLVYEYMKNNSLARALFGPEESRLEMDWPTRQKICIGIAKGLAFMHEESPLKIVHRDIKADNILLDENLNPKISDFGLAKLDEEENTHISTKRIAGTLGYMAPEYVLHGCLTYKADVYSFGVVALEIVAGKSNMKYRPSENIVSLIDWAFVLQKNGSLLDLVDPKLGFNFNEGEVEKVIRIGLLCTSPSPSLRPIMSEVVSMLRGDVSIQEFNMVPAIYDNELKLQALRQNYQELYQNSTDSQSTRGNDT